MRIDQLRVSSSIEINNSTSDPLYISGSGATPVLKVSGSGEVMVGVSEPYAGALLSVAGTVSASAFVGDGTALTTSVGLSGFDTDVSDLFKLMNGVAFDDPSVTVASNGTTITLSLEKIGGGDIRYLFSDGVYALDCTPASTVALTAGTDANPQINYVYVLQSNKTLTASTTSFPVTEYSAVATVLCQSAASLQTDGAYKVHSWQDHVVNSGGIGHLSHLNYWIRQQPATWVNGTALTPTVGAGQFDIATTSGTVLQVHEHAFPAFDTSTGSSIFVANDFTSPYKKVGDLLLASVGEDVNGVTLGDAATDYYNLVIWGAVSEDTSDCKLFVNVPDGAYLNDNGSQATNDVDRTAIYDIPADFVGVGFLIARLTVSVSGGTYTIEQQEDLRGKFPTTAPGGGSGGGVSTFAELTDTPSTYISNAYKLPQVNAGETGLEFTDSPTLANLTVTGVITAQELRSEFISSSIIYSSGSNRFGDLVTDLHQFTGSLAVSSSNDSYFLGGNVGIGTTSPSAKLDIYAGSNSSGIRLRGLTDTTEISDIYVGASGALILDNTNGTDTGAWIDMRSEDNQYGVIIRESDGTGTTTFANLYVTDAADDYLSINVNSTTNGNALVVTAANNVGIGTITPSAKLEVNGDIKISGTSKYYFNSNTSSYIGQRPSNTKDVIIASDRNFAFDIDSNDDDSVSSFIVYHGGDINANQIFRVNTNYVVSVVSGSLGIEAESPDYKLDVNGTFGFTPGSSVTPVDNGDVVFQATSDTQFTIKYKGSDGTIRSSSITLA